MDELIKVFDEKTYIIKNRILIKLTKKEIKAIIKNPKNNSDKVDYLAEVFLCYKKELIRLFSNLEKESRDFSYFKFIFEQYNNKKTFINLFENTLNTSLVKLFEECFIPFDDFSNLVSFLRNELIEESKFLNEEEFNIVYINEILNVLKDYSFKI